MVASATVPTDRLPGWVTLVRAPNPGVMTLDGTNTWVLRAPDGEYGIVVDPGPDDEGHLAAVAAHAPVGLILITHGHPDHVAGARRLAGLLGGIGVLAADPAHCVGTDPLDVDEHLGGAGIEIRTLTTPGHTADSVCFHAEIGGRSDGPDGDAPGGPQSVILTGDTILGRGSTVVAWPDGDLGEYLSSLERLSAYPGIMALPGHGPVLADCAEAAGAYLAHRRERLDQVRTAVAAGATDAASVVAAVYADVDRSLWPAAEWSVRAQLAYLDREVRESAPHAGGLDRP